MDESQFCGVRGVTERLPKSRKAWSLVPVDGVMRLMLLPEVVTDGAPIRKSLLPSAFMSPTAATLKPTPCDCNVACLEDAQTRVGRLVALGLVARRRVEGQSYRR